MVQEVVKDFPPGAIAELAAENFEKMKPDLVIPTIQQPCDHAIGLDYGNPQHDESPQIVRLSEVGTCEGVNVDKQYQFERFEYCPRCGEKLEPPAVPA